MTTAAPPTPLSKDARRRMVAERKKTSLYWRLVHLLGSLQLALVLISTIAIAVAIATFYESAYNAKIAAAKIYDNPLFIFWLGVLCINLFAVTLTRWPWERKHTGFIVTHYGIITLLIGAVVGSQLGFEGNVTLHVDKAPVDRITTSRSVLQVESPRDGALYLLDFDAEAVLPTEERPKTLPLPDTNYKLVTDDFSPNLLDEERLVASTDPAALPGVQLHLHSDTAGQHTDLPLALLPDGGVEKDFFGMARVAFLPELLDRAPQPIAETQMIFAKFAPVVTAPDGSTGVRVSLSEDGTRVTITAPDGTAATYARTEILNQPLTVGPATVTLGDYWPDFQLADGRPSSASDQPNNPAGLVRITGPVHSHEHGISDELTLELAPTADRTGVDWQAVRGSVATASGTAAVGDTFAPGWADWTVEVTEFFPQSETLTDSRPGDDSVKGVPGFHARLRAPGGTEGPAKWIASGALTTLAHDRTVVRLGYGLELRPAPFTIGLEKFEVPRYEGTETPANYISTVEFTETETGATKSAVAQMNQPASWPGGVWANLTGINYKFSQAEWNPRDLGETTLQVLYDPGWSLKWIGSLFVCAGIFIQFYLKPKKRSGGTLPPTTN